MPVVFVHGVNVRQDSTYETNVAQRNLQIKELILRQLLTNPNRVSIFNPYWGRYAASLAWGGISLPTGRVQALDPLQALDPDQALIEQLLSGNDIPLPKAANQTLLTIANISLPDAVDLLFALAANQANKGQRTTELTELIRLSPRYYDYAEQYRKPDWLREVNSDQEFIARLRAEVDQWQAPPPPQSLGLTDAWAGVKEGVDRLSGLVGNLSSRALLTLTRKPLNTAVSHFIGDVFVYLDKRKDQTAPGLIVREITNHLDQAVTAIDPNHDPYLIVIAHSMGGNIVYDLLTHFCPNKYPIDLLVTVGSQVALFEELKLYRASQEGIPIDPRQERIAMPAGVKHWLNVFDTNDVLSFAAAGVFDGVTDFAYSTGKHVIAAHTAYFLRGSFYRRLATHAKALLNP